MTTSLTHPLQSLLQSASKSLPATTGAVDTHQRRLAGAGTATVILADVSSSMVESAGAKRRVDHLQEALAVVLPQVAGASVIAFSTTPAEVTGAALPQPSGSTALHLAIDAAAAKRPRRTILISDGEPDSASLALESAARCPGTIDVIYCGPDGGVGLAFLRDLARRCGGRAIYVDLAVAGTDHLLTQVRRLALPPGPTG